MSKRKVQVRTRAQALAMIASSLNGHIEACTWDELLGLLPTDVDALTDAELDRLNWARTKVTAALRKWASDG